MSNMVSSDETSFLGVKQRLCALGASPYVLSRPEVSRLAKLMHPGEEVEAFIYGANSAGWGMLVATNLKLLFVNKRLMNLIVDEVSYPLVNSINHSFGPLSAKITLHTGPKVYDFRKVNRKCAGLFSAFIQGKLLENEAKAEERERAVAASRNLVESMEYQPDDNRVEGWVGG